MAARRWKLGRSYGFAGTKSEEEIDICDYLGISEEEAEAMSNDDAESQLADMEWESAVEQVNAWASPIE